MSQVVEGVVRDGRIVLAEGVDLADGQRVRVVVESHPAVESAGPPSTPEEGEVSTPMEDPELIALLAGIRRDRPPLPPGPSGPGRKSAAGRLVDDPTWDEHLREVLESRKSVADRESPE